MLVWPRGEGERARKEAVGGDSGQLSSGRLPARLEPEARAKLTAASLVFLLSSACRSLRLLMRRESGVLLSPCRRRQRLSSGWAEQGQR